MGLSSREETMEQVLAGGLWWLSGNSWYCRCGNFLRMGSLEGRVGCVGS